MNISIFKELTTAEKLAAIVKESEKYKGIVANMDDPQERKKIKKDAAEIGDILKKLDRRRIDVKKEFSESVEKEAAMIRGTLESAVAPLTKLIEDHKEKQRKIREAEKAKAEKVESTFVRMNDMALEAVGQTSVVIGSLMDELACFDFDPDLFGGRIEEAVKKHQELMQKMEAMKYAAIAQEELEEKRAEIERKEAAQKAAEEERKRKEEQARIAKEAAEKARMQAELDHRLAIERAEKEKVEAQEKAEQQRLYAEQQAELARQEAERREKAAVEAERQRQIAIEKVKKEEAERRERDIENKKRVHNEALNDLINNGIDDDTAKNIIVLIAKGQVKNIKINY